MAIKRVFSTIQMVIAKSTKGSITIRFTISLILIQTGPHSQIRNVLANLYQHGGQFLWDSSSSGSKEYNYGNHEKKSKTFLRLQDVNIPSTNVLVNALITLLARSLRPNDVLSCSMETIREPESFFLISRSEFGCQEENNEGKQTHHNIIVQLVARRNIFITELVRERLAKKRVTFLTINTFCPKEPFECIKAETCWTLTGEKVGRRYICH